MFSIGSSSSSDAVHDNQFAPRDMSREEFESIAKIFRLSIGENCDTETLQIQCFNAVWTACEENNWEPIQKAGKLLENLTDENGESVVFKSIRTGDTEKVQKIIENNLNCLLSARQYEFSWHIAARWGRKEFLVEQNKKTEGLQQKKETQEIVLEGGGSYLKKDYKGRYPLHIAIKYGFAEMIEYPVLPESDRAFLQNARYFSRKYNSIFSFLAYAVIKGQIACIDRLIELDPTLCQIRIEGNMTILHLAIHAKQLEVLRRLLKNHHETVRASLEVQDDSGRTPLILAVISENCDALELLIEYGAKVENTDFEGRTALHYALNLRKKDIIKLLLSSNSTLLEKNDFSGKRPVDLLNLEDHNDKWINDFCQCFSLHASRENIKKNNNETDFIENPPENLVFKGGGPKGIAYLGAIRVLEQRQILPYVKRVAGTSAGAITATFIAMGFGAEESEELLTSAPGTYFLDHPLTRERMESFYDNLSLGNFFAYLRQVRIFDLLLINSVLEFTGLCDGERFRKFIDAEIEKKTGIAHCTFGELAELLAQDKRNPQGVRFKDLHIYATEIRGDTPRIAHFCADDPEWQELVIADAVRASISLPFIFKPHTLTFKRKTKDGTFELYTRSKVYEDSKKRLHRIKSVYIDGGLLRNFPIDVFDHTKYMTYSEGQIKNGKQFNPRTLGFTLRAPVGDIDIQEEPVETTLDLAVAIYSIFRHSEKWLEEETATENDGRTVVLNTQGIKLSDFNVEPANGLGKKAIEEAEKETETFFKRFENKDSKIEVAKEIEVPVIKKRDKGKEHVDDDEETSMELDEIEKEKPLETTPELHESRENYWWTRFRFWIKAGLSSNETDTIFYELMLKDCRLFLFERLMSSIHWEVDQSFEVHKAFFTNPDFSKTYLPEIVRTDRKEIIAYLAKKNIPVNIINNEIPMIHRAVKFSCHQTFEALLLAPDYDETVRDKKGNSVFHVIAKKGRTIFYEIITQNKKDTPYLLQSHNKSHETPLLVAARCKRLFFVEKLINHPSVDLAVAHPETGKTLLHFLAETETYEGVLFNFIESARKKEILNQLVDLENRAQDSILFATQNRGFLRTFIEIGIDLTRKQKNTNKTLLYMLAKNNDIELVKLFCTKLKENHRDSFFSVLNHEAHSSQIDSGTKNPRLKTALIIAGEKNNYEVVRYLIEEGAKFRKEVDGRTAIDYAPRFLRSDSYQILLSALCGDVERDLTKLEKIRALAYCVENGYFDAAKKLIRNKFVPFPISNNPLLIVIKSKAFSWEQIHVLVRLLLNGRNKDDVNQSDPDGTTPLIFAAKNDLDTLRILLESEDVDVNMQDEKGNAALHYAVMGTRPNTTQALLDHNGINPSIQNKRGKTPLHLVEDIAIARKLLDLGVDLTLHDRINKTAIQQAQLHNRHEISELIEKYL